MKLNTCISADFTSFSLAKNNFNFLFDALDILSVWMVFPGQLQSLAQVSPESAKHKIILKLF